MKARWFTLDTTAGVLEALKEHIFENQYTEGVISGYVPIEIKKDTLSAQFIEEVTLSFDTFTPEHGVTAIEQTVQNISNVRVTESVLPIEIDSGPYGGTTLLRDLVRACRDRASLEPLSIDVLQLLQEMKTLLFAPKIQELRVTGVSVSAESHASLTICGGDVLNAMTALVGSRPSKVTSCKIVELKGILCQCNISALGRCSVVGHDAEHVLSILRMAVTEHVRRNETTRIRKMKPALSR